MQTILQTNDNFIWLGTSNGLFRFDGLAYEHFLQDSSSNIVTALFQDVKGVLWIGYRSGKIGKIKDGKFLNFEPEEGFPQVAITGFAQAKDSAVWFSTYGEGVYFFHKNRLYNFSAEDGLSDDFVYGITSGSDGNVWVGTDAGITACSYQNGKKKALRIDTKSGLPDNIVTAVRAGTDGKIWLGTESAGVCYYDPATKRCSFNTSSWNFGPVISLVQWHDKIWAGTPRNGIIEIDLSSGKTSRLQEQNKVLPSRISELITDREENIWIAGGTSAFYSANPTFTFLSQRNGEPIRNIQAILYCRNGDLWYSSGKGVMLIGKEDNNPQNLQAVINKSKLATANVISMFEDAAGNIWFGTFDEGAFVLNPATAKIRQLTEQNGLANNNVLSISGVANTVWLATLGGVSECEITGRDFAATDAFYIRNYTSQHGLGSNYIYKVFADSKQRVWFATDGKGITVLENGKFRTFSFKGSSSNNVIYSVTEDSKGDIWISTATSGLFCYNGQKFAAYSPKNKLRDLGITSIIGTRTGNILIVSKQGIDVLNVKTGIIQYHGREVGISDIDPSLNAYSADDQGNIWLGVQNGIIKYNSEAALTRAWPVTHINKMLVFLDDPQPDEFGKLDHDRNHISFDYIGFWYHDPEEVTYQIKLEGYDREWTSSKNSFVTYPNLPPGKYIFKVRSSATGYFGGADTKEYAFSISPPFYNTWWFYALVLLAAGAILYAIIKYRERRLKLKERQKKEQIEFQFQTLKSQVNPHFLFNSFNTLIAVIEEDQETAVEYVEKLSDFYRNILLHREEDLISLKEELEMIDTYYFLQLKRYKSNFKMTVQVPEPERSFQIPPLTLQLLVENAVKHNIISKDKPLTVDIFTEPGYLVVRNNLQPKQQHEPSTGLGLQNIGSRYKLLTSKTVLIEKNSEDFTVKLPLLPPQP